MVDEPDGRIVAITGGSRGIGRAAAARLAARGDRVVLGARGKSELRSAVAELVDGGRRAWGRPLDVTSTESVHAWFEWVAATVGTPDVCILSAGVGHWTPIEKMTDEAWRHIVSVNIDGVFFCTRAALGPMLEAGRGHLIYLSSVMGSRGVPNMAAYAASKAAVATFAESVAIEVKPRGIKVTVLYPGTTETGMRDHQRDRPQTSDITQPELQLGADDVAAAIEWVTGASARSFPTGVFLEPLGAPGAR
jgi:NAD(P)-dependent dehydrogenase (short-subunit alcohol dehydrogenase family)